MKLKDLKNFIIEQRTNKNLTWDETAKVAATLGIKTKKDKPYSGAGFQNYINRKLGKKKWGKCINRTSEIKSKQKDDQNHQPESSSYDFLSTPQSIFEGKIIAIIGSRDDVQKILMELNERA